MPAYYRVRRRVIPWRLGTGTTACIAGFPLPPIVLGAALWWMDEVGFDEDPLDMRWRRRIGMGNIGVVFMAGGLAGLLFGP